MEPTFTDKSKVVNGMLTREVASIDWADKHKNIKRGPPIDLPVGDGQAKVSVWKICWSDLTTNMTIPPRKPR